MKADKQFFMLCAFHVIMVQQVIGDAFVMVPKKIIKCSRCPPGWGVYKNCSVNSNTICKKCESRQTYSSVYSLTSPCSQCSRCGVGLYESHVCSLTKDTVCSECISHIGQKQLAITNDFVEKCSYMFKNHINRN